MVQEFQKFHNFRNNTSVISETRHASYESLSFMEYEIHETLKTYGIVGKDCNMNTLHTSVTDWWIHFVSRWMASLYYGSPFPPSIYIKIRML